MVKKTGIITLFFALILVSSWYLLPVDWITEKIESMSKFRFAGYTIKPEIDNFKKGLPYRFSIKGLSFKVNDHKIGEFEDISGATGLLTLFDSYLSVVLQGRFLDGSCSCSMTITPEGLTANFHFNDTDMERLLKNYPLGVQGRGVLSGRGSLYISFDTGESEGFHYIGVIDPMAFEDIKIGNHTIPLSIFKEMSFTLRQEDKGLYLLRGVLTSEKVKGYLNVDIKGYHISGFLDIITDNDYRDKEKLQPFSDVIADNIYFISLNGNVLEIYRELRKSKQERMQDR